MKAILLVPEARPLADAREVLGWLDAHGVRSVALVPPEALADLAAFAGEEPVVVLDQGLVAGFDLGGLLRAHAAFAAVATLALRCVGPNDSGVRVEKDHSGRILRFARHDPAAALDLGFAGCVAMRPELLQRIPRRPDVDLVRDLLSGLLREHAILGGWVIRSSSEQSSPIEVAGGCA